MYRWKISIGKDVPHRRSSGKWKLKQQWDTTTHLLEEPNPRTLVTPSASQAVEQQELSFFTGGNAEWDSHFGRQVAIFYKIKPSLPIQYSSHAPWYYPKELETYIHTKICMWMFIIILFTISKTCKQPRHTLVGEWINNYPFIYLMHQDNGIFIN